MLKKLFAWKFSGVFILVLFVLGGVSWRVALYIQHYRWMFFAGGLYFVAGLLLSMGWIWRNPLFRGLPQGLATIQSERRGIVVKPRKGKKQVRRGLTIGFTVIFCVAFLSLLQSYRARATREFKSRVEIYLSDGVETRAMLAPLLDRSFHARNLVFAMANVPVKDVGIQPGDTTMPIQVILRNMSARAIEGAHVDITSDAVIHPRDGQMVALSGKELTANTVEIDSFPRTSHERVLNVDVSIREPRTKIGFYVIVSGGDLQSTAGVENVHPVEPEEEAPVRISTRARAQGPAHVVR